MAGATTSGTGFIISSRRCCRSLAAEVVDDRPPAIDPAIKIEKQITKERDELAKIETAHIDSMGRSDPLAEKTRTKLE